MAVGNVADYLVSELNFEKIGNLYVYVPEGHDGNVPLDAEIYFTGAGGVNADVIPYAELAKNGYDKLIILTAKEYSGDIPQVMHSYEEKGAQIGTIDVNAHSALCRQAIRATNGLSDAGYSVANANILDGRYGLSEYGNGYDLKDEEYQKFSTTGANLNVFSSGSTGGGPESEKKNLVRAAENGVPVTYTLMDFEGSSRWDAKHVAVNRDLVYNDYFDILSGKKDTFTFDKPRLTASDYSYIGNYPAYVTGIDYSVRYNEETHTWDTIYDKDINGNNYGAVVTQLSSKSNMYGPQMPVTLLVSQVHDEMNTMTALLSIFSTNYKANFQELPSSDKLVVCRGELEAFKSSGIITNLKNQVNEIKNIHNLITSFRENVVLKGDVWGLAYDKLDVYDKSLSIQAQIVEEFSNAIIEAVDELIACYDRYPDVPADKIQTTNLEELTEVMTQLRYQLDNTPEKTSVKDETTGEMKKIDNPVYKDAKEQYDEAKLLVDAITDFKTTYETVKIALDAAMDKVEAFGNEVANITPSPSYTFV